MDNLVELLYVQITIYGVSDDFERFKVNRTFFFTFLVTGGNIRKKSIKVYGRQIQIELM